MKPFLITILAAAVSVWGGPPGPRRSPARISPRVSAAAVNNPAAPIPRLSGSSAVRAQILLDQAGFSVGEIDGSLGRNTLGALAAFRQAHNFPPADHMDQTTWRALNSGSTPALVSYSITDDDLKGPFLPIPADMMEKSKLDYLGYASPLEELAEKFHCSPEILKALNRGATFDTAGEMLMVPAVRAAREAKAAKVVVSKSDSSVSAFDAQGNLIVRYPASSGSEHDPLPIGEWKITYIARNPRFNYNPDLFWDADSKQAKAVIKPGPNNPVGLVWMNLSKEHYGIHGTPEPSQIGHTESHGCIRLTNWDALELAGMVAPGTPVTLEE
jgi:lipoprotein-anchoring transpeptidase ErfK/SrfK